MFCYSVSTCEHIAPCCLIRSHQLRNCWPVERRYWSRKDKLHSAIRVKLLHTRPHAFYTKPHATGGSAWRYGMHRVTHGALLYRYVRKRHVCLITILLLIHRWDTHTFERFSQSGKRLYTLIPAIRCTKTTERSPCRYVCNRWLKSNMACLMFLCIHPKIWHLQI